MGLRDALKAKVKGILGVAPTTPNRGAPESVATGSAVPSPAPAKLTPINPVVSASAVVSPTPASATVVSPTPASVGAVPAPVTVAHTEPAEVPATSAAPAAKNAPPSGLSWHIVAPAGKVTEDKPGTYAHGRYNVSVFRHQGKLYAMDDACAHEDGPLGEGALDGNCVVCPYHDWRYEFTTGKCLTEPDRARATFAVKEETGQLWLGERLTHGSDSRGGDHDDGMEVIRK